MNYPDNFDLSILDDNNPAVLGFVVMHDTAEENDSVFTTYQCAITEAKAITKENAEDSGFNFESATVEMKYDTDEDGEIVWENDTLFKVEYDNSLREWNVTKGGE